MTVHPLDLLASLMAVKQRARGLGLREMGREMELAPATVARLLKGSRSPHWPDFNSLQQASAWVGHQFELVEHRG